MVLLTSSSSVTARGGGGRLHAGQMGGSASRAGMGTAVSASPKQKGVIQWIYV